MRKVIRQRKMKGAGFFDWIKGAANTINDGLKKSKIISTVAGLAPIPYGSAVSTVARNLGYGRKQIRGNGKTTKKRINKH